MRRVTTSYSEGDPKRRVDFLEVYWAHLMRGNTVGGTIEWIVSLLVRQHGSVPPSLKAVWLAAFIVLGFAAAVFGPALLPGGMKRRLFEDEALAMLRVPGSPAARTLSALERVAGGG